MKKNGFTLVELLAVLTVLSIILLIAIPSLTNVINKSREKIIKDNIISYGKAIENAVANYFVKYPEKDEVTLEQLNNEGLLKTSGSKVECDIVQISKKKTYLSECTVNGKDVDIEYGKYDPAPELEEGLIPVEYKNDKWVVANEYSNTWYNYDEQKWANAVTLLPGITKEVGDEVKVDGTEASMMLVWIPRFEYKYTNLGDQYAGGTQEQPGEIEVNLIPKEKTEPSDESKYKIHPAFTFGDKELSGIWIGKFELSHTTKSHENNIDDYDNSNLNCSTNNCSEAENLRTLPNVPNLRYNNVSNFFFGIKSIENTSLFGLSNIDTHMIKKVEWASAAYLSQSKYGKYGNKDYSGINKKIYQKKSIYYITGLSNGTAENEVVNEQCTYNDMTYLGTGKGKCGPGASTTGNIYGVYDMSGGAEYLMAVYGESQNKIYSGKDHSHSSGFNGWLYDNGDIIEETNGINMPDFKYYDLYIPDSTQTICNANTCYGDGLLETNSWYNNYYILVEQASPWFIAGSFKIELNSTGIFDNINAIGTAAYYVSTRVVFVKK